MLTHKIPQFEAATCRSWSVSKVCQNAAVAARREATVLILPGHGGSGAAHWQTCWEMAHPNFRRIQQRDWYRPCREDWVETLDAALAESASSAILVTHSLGCLTLAHWVARYGRPLRGALVVAPPDPLSPVFPADATGFASLPEAENGWPFPTVVVASTNDPFGSFEFARSCASRWGAQLINAGAIGHINADSGIGHWPDGFRLLDRLIANS